MKAKKKVKKLTPTQLLEKDLILTRQEKREMAVDNAVLRAENRVLKEVFDLHFKKGMPSLIKALRVVTESIVEKYNLSNLRCE